MRVFSLPVLFLLTACSTSTIESGASAGSGGASAGSGGTAPSAQGGEGGEGGEGGQAAQAGTGGAQQPASDCLIDKATGPCECDDNGEPVPGRRTCSIATGWGPCECADVPSTLISNPGSIADPAANRRPESFEWMRTLPLGGTCESGHYEGSFDGMYNPAISFGFSTSAVDGSLVFDLGESTNGEFFEVSNGYMTGLALDLYPFEGEIQGTLDCTNLFFDGYLRNCNYIIWGLTQYFEGVIRARYDAVNHVFVSGVWSVTEIDLNGAFPPPQPINPGDPLPPLPLLGGVGTWSTTWVP